MLILMGCLKGERHGLERGICGMGWVYMKGGSRNAQ
jgi:hypothetical protein